MSSDDGGTRRVVAGEGPSSTTVLDFKQKSHGWRVFARRDGKARGGPADSATSRPTLTRRKALKVAAASAALPLVHIRSGRAAGKLSVAFWKHWVPAGNVIMRQQVDAWSKQNQVAVALDFITSIGQKNVLTLEAEAKARTGHDIQQFPTWEVHNEAALLEPLDEVMEHLTGKYGPVNQMCEYLARVKGHWLAVPTSTGTQNKGPCARISVLKEKAGLDVQAMYPAKPVYTAEQAAWTWDEHLKAAEACAKAGMPFGIGLGGTTDSVDTAGSLFAAFGAELVDRHGNITVKSDAVRQALEYGQKLVKFLPKDAAGWGNESNNQALISGKAALIWNPPSAWAVARKQAPKIAADCWTFQGPRGPAGRFTPYLPFFWGIWRFARNKSAAKELIAYLMQKDNVHARCDAVAGYDIPPFESMLDFKVWQDMEPPKGTLYNYPTRAFHKATPHIAAYPAPPSIAVMIYNAGTMPAMLAKLQAGQSIDQVIAWATAELNDFVR